MTNGDKERYRVEAAIAAMQALIHSGQMWQRTTRESAIKTAVEMADALMKELGLDRE